MSNSAKDNEQPVDGFKNESTRQRWNLFHRAIAHAKQSNFAALAEEQSGDESAATSPDAKATTS